MKKLIVLTLALVTLIAASSSAQSRKELRINEVMVLNESSVTDDYGRRSAWIELFNSNFAPLEIAKIYITDDISQPKKYPVPVGDVNTRIPKRQHILFWADDKSDHGTFHLNFSLKPGQPNFIAIFDADGKTLIDSVTIPASLQADQSYARDQDGVGSWVIRRASQDNPDDYITPSSANIIVSSNSKVEFFSQKDENGLGLTIVAMGIVFTALLLLCICFYCISKIGAAVQHRNKMKSSSAQAPVIERRDASGEEIAAIVMALHEHLNVHDNESAILTLNKVKKAYSPWNSKIYNMRPTPNRNLW